MIYTLYTFTSGSYVVADEWNQNFIAIKQSNDDCEEAIVDANNAIAFQDSDLSSIKAVYKSKSNCFEIPALNQIAQPGIEYYKALPDGQDLTITVPNDFTGQARVLVKTNSVRTLPPVAVTGGQTKVEYGRFFNTLYHYVFIFGINGNIIVKINGLEV